jgi:hypothetical protein
VAGQALYLDDLFSFFEIQAEIVSPKDSRLLILDEPTAALAFPAMPLSCSG